MDSRFKLRDTRYEYLILGGGIAGWTAAETLRKLLPDADICIVGEENELLYSRVLLPHYVNGKIKREKVFLRHPDSHKNNNIIFLEGVFAKRIEAAGKVVFLSNGEEINYGKLLIATGGRPAMPAIPGFGRSGVRKFRTLADADKIVEDLDKLPAGRDCVVVGSSFISLEFPHFFSARSLRTHIVIRGEGFFHRYINKDAMRLIENELCTNGAIFYKNEEVESFLGNDFVSSIKLKRGGTLPAKFVGVGFGLAPSLDFAAASGIKIGQGIITNEYLEASVLDIWCAGDVCEFFDVLAGRWRRVGNWVNAQEQGRLAAVNMAGERKKFELVSSYALHIFKLPVAFVGDFEARPGDEIIDGDSRESGFVRRLILREGFLVGATLVGDLSSRKLVTRLIYEKTKIGKGENINF